MNANHSAGSVRASTPASYEEKKKLLHGNDGSIFHAIYTIGHGRRPFKHAAMQSGCPTHV